MTSALLTHLRSRHNTELSRTESERSETKPQSTACPTASVAATSHKRVANTTLEEVLAERQTCDADHVSAVLGRKYLAEMIAAPGSSNKQRTK